MTSQTLPRPIDPAPLAGKRIVVTRAREQADDLLERLRSLGAEPLLCPAIMVSPPADPGPLDGALASAAMYDWVIFTSVNGVEAVVERLRASGSEPASVGFRRIAAIGPATAGALEEIGWKVDFVPERFVAEAIVEGIGEVHGQRILLPRADIARPALATGLRGRGARVDEVTAYQTVAGQGAGRLAALLQRDGADAVTFTSSSTVRYSLEGMEEAGLSREEVVALLDRTAVVCIGPITAATARNAGLRVAAVAEEYTVDGMVRAVVRLFARD